MTQDDSRLFLVLTFYVVCDLSRPAHPAPTSPTPIPRAPRNGSPMAPPYMLPAYRKRR